MPYFWRKFRVVPRRQQPLTPCVPLFCTLFKRGGSRRAFRLPGEGGDHSIIRWNLRPVKAEMPLVLLRIPRPALRGLSGARGVPSRTEGERILGMVWTLEALDALNCRAWGSQPHSRWGIAGKAWRAFPGFFPEFCGISTRKTSKSQPYPEGPKIEKISFSVDRLQNHSPTHEKIILARNNHSWIEISIIDRKSLVLFFGVREGSD